jgi:hypothetical protein
MALNGLRQELPRVSALARRIPNPRVARAPMLWAILAAFGAALFVGAAITVLFSLLYRLFSIPGDAWVPRPFQLSTIAMIGIALAVGWVSGGRQAVAAWAAIIVFERFVSLWGLGKFCGTISSAPPLCSPLGYVLGLWPEVLGVALGYRLARWFRVAEGSGNPVLEAAGALAVIYGLLASTQSLLTVPTTSFEAGLIGIAAALTSGVACGLVLLARLPEARRWTVLGAVALGVALPWLVVSVPAYLESVGIGGKIATTGLNLLEFFAPLLQIGSASFVLYIAATRKVTTEPA